MDVGIAVEKYSGVAKNLEVYIYGGGVYNNNIVAADSIFGHPAAPNAIAVAAIDWADAGHDTISTFQAGARPPSTGWQGLCPMSPGSTASASPVPAGSRATSTARARPPREWPPSRRSSGAAHTATTPSRSESYLLNSCDDRGTGGFDYTFGYGLLNAQKYANNIGVPTITSVVPNRGSRGQTLTLDIYGGGFMSGAQVELLIHGRRYLLYLPDRRDRSQQQSHPVDSHHPYIGPT